MQTTMKIKTPKLRQFQDLMKRHNFYFMYNPVILGDETRVGIDGNHLSIQACNDFFIEWERMNMKVTEKKSSRYTQFKRRLLAKASQMYSCMTRVVGF